MNKLQTKNYRLRTKFGQSLIELILVFGLASIMLPALITGFTSSREGRAQQDQRLQASNLMAQTREAIRAVRESGWTSIPVNGTYHPVQTGSTWTLSPGIATSSGLTQSVVISDVYRDTNGAIASGSGTTIDNSTKQFAVTISWLKPNAASMTSIFYLTRYMDNLTYLQTDVATFSQGTMNNTAVPTPPSGNGEITLAPNSKAKWCSPAFSSSTIDLPDGPPVAVAATASATTTTIPNDVFVATAPNTSSSIKMAYVNVTANVDPPVSSLRGTFTMDSTKYSTGRFPTTVPSPNTFDNNFKTNDIKYYKSSSGKTYALIATNLPTKEIIAVQINNGAGDAWQDPTNKIYKYWTFYNTKIYPASAGNDQAPYGYGATALKIYEDKGYVLSGGFLYVFDLSNIDTKNPTTPLDQVGCRIQVEGADCLPGNPNGEYKKYNPGQTNANFSAPQAPRHNTCADGGNIQLYADEHMDVTRAPDGNIYVFVAIGGQANDELNIVKAQTPPTGSNLTNNNCGITSRTSPNWRTVGALDFNPNGNSEESANSIYVKNDGSRAYITSNGATFTPGNGNGTGPDSYQFYVIDTSNKTNPAFLATNANWLPTKGYYYGTTIVNGGTTYYNDQLFPKRSLTVLNGQRAVLVGKNGLSNGNLTQEYQVLNLDNETTVNYCAGLPFPQGFNDLTYVREADGDNFVYMVANTPDHQLKIIQGGPDGSYNNAGTFESLPFYPGYKTAFNRFDATATTSASTSIQYQVAVADRVGGSCTGATYNYVGPDGTASTFFPASGGVIFWGNTGAYHNPGECFRYKATLTTTDLNTTPTIYDVTVNYSP